MSNSKRIVIIGATSAIAVHCARLWLERQHPDLILVGRDAERIQRVARDLKARSPQSDIRGIVADFIDPKAISNTVSDIVKGGRVDILLIAQGSLSEQAECQEDLRACRDALEVNGISPVLYAEAFAKEMERTDHGKIALIASVAGDRGRKCNYVYGAAKGLITRYAQGLQHRFSGTAVRVVLIKPGPTDTPMTSALKNMGAKLAAVDTVAKQIVEGIDNGKLIIYTPKEWWLIMKIIQHLPSQIFNRLSI